MPSTPGTGQPEWVDLTVDGARVSVPAGSSLLDALREELGVRSVKDGCSPQGQCGCCTVLVDGAARVACVTPVRRVRGRAVTTVDGLEPGARRRWAEAFLAHGASQCGFCTPGIIVRLEALRRRRLEPGSGDGRSGDEVPDLRRAADAVKSALGAHLCRCTGWQSIVEAGVEVLAGARSRGAGETGVSAGPGEAARGPEPLDTRRRLMSEWRAELEGRVLQAVGPAVVLGAGGFADDRAPRTALVAVPGPHGVPVVGESLVEARRAIGKIQGRRTTRALQSPLELPPGDWPVTLQTTWVEPAYLEPDASWCRLGTPPASPVANGGAFGGKVGSPVPAEACHLASETGRDVRSLWYREHVVRCGHKRPPIAAGLRRDGTGVVRVVRSPGSGSLEEWTERVRSVAPGLTVEVVEVPGPPVSVHPRGAGWAEATVLLVAIAPPAPSDPIVVTAPDGGRAAVGIAADGAVSVEVWAGEALDEVVLRSYCLGAVHQGLGWVRSEGIAVDGAGEVHDLTIRSFGILPARDVPPVSVVVHPQDTTPRHVSDAVFAATAAAAWRADGWASAWPTGRSRALGAVS